MFDWNNTYPTRNVRENSRSIPENFDFTLPTNKSTSIPTVNDNKDRERINRLKERVGNVQKKLETMEKTEKTARKLYNILDDMESPIKLPPPVDQSIKFNTLTLSQNRFGFSDNDLNLTQKQNLATHRQFSSLGSMNENFGGSTNFDDNSHNSHYSPNSNDMKGIDVFVNNQKTKSLKDILIKMDKFKSNPPHSSKIISYCQSKIENNKPFYYDFVKENELVNLKVFAQILYEEIENLANLIEIDKNTLEILEKKFDEKQFLCNKFAEEKVEQNIMIEELNKNLLESDEKSSKFGFLLAEIKFLFQSIIEEFGKSNGICNENKQNLSQSIKTMLNQISKFSLSCGQDMSTNLTHIFDDHKINEYSNIMNFLSDDKNNLSNVNSSNFDFVADKRNSKPPNGDFINKVIFLENENKKLKNQIEEISLEKEKKAKISNNQSFNQSVNQNYLVLLDELKKNAIEKDQLENKLVETNEKLMKSDGKCNDLVNKLNEFDQIIIENNGLKKELEIINEEFGFMEQKYNDQLNELSQQYDMLSIKHERLFEDNSLLEKKYMQLISERNDLSLKYEHISQTIDKTLQDKENTINSLTQEKLSLENYVNQLRDHEKKYINDIKHAGDIEVIN